MTLWEFGQLQKGYFEAQRDKEKREWERTRWQTYILLQPHIKANSLRKPSDLIKFEWEKEQTPDIVNVLKSGLMNDFPKEL